MSSFANFFVSLWKGFVAWFKSLRPAHKDPTPAEYRHAKQEVHEPTVVEQMVAGVDHAVKTVSGAIKRAKIEFEHIPSARHARRGRISKTCLSGMRLTSYHQQCHNKAPMFVTA